MLSLSISRTALRSAAAPRQFAVAATSARYASTKTLTEAVSEIVPAKREQFAKLKSEYADCSLGDSKVSHLIGGMRGLKCMLWEGSVLDAEEGITFHGKSIPECQASLPSAADIGRPGKEMLPESMLWLLLTGKVPSAEEVKGLSQDLSSRGKLPNYIEKIIDSFPKTLHPMTQFSAAVSALNHDSKFAAAYNAGVKKTEYWHTTLEDSLDLIAKLPAIAARIYYNVFGKGDGKQTINPDMDLIENMSHMMGYGKSEGLVDYLRLYIAVHGDHEGGNVSAHTAHLVGSALSDPYLSYAAALNGLAGPLHGLANQEVLNWALEFEKAVGSNPSDQQIVDYLWSTLKSGRVVPGYGHAVLRKPDPRFTALSHFTDSRPELQESPIVQLVQRLSKIAPSVLKEHGKTKNPYPNVDAASGCVLYTYGLDEFKFYTVIFGVSRALGALPQLVFDRILGLPIERPKSLSMDALMASLKK
ncbi:citrate (Si)-synthase [Malassezia pachydermatis]|uniref:Citrate synthase n=1 Tax=Malassezia pachydermatis TaxID=77020 RepID=A0A0M8MMZ8_9BASI|nr:citrate synthase [Malassezia pachydermatis]KOS14838.1 citrate synthase [Malassezia pachydermatis]